MAPIAACVALKSWIAVFCHQHTAKSQQVSVRVYFLFAKARTSQSKYVVLVKYRFKPIKDPISQYQGIVSIYTGNYNHLKTVPKQ